MGLTENVPLLGQRLEFVCLDHRVISAVEKRGLSYHHCVKLFVSYGKPPNRMGSQA